MIKKYWIIFGTVLFLFQLSSLAQTTLSQYEYWIDDKLHNVVPIPNSDNESLEFTIATKEQNLSDGFHKLYYRIQDSQGVYGALNSWMFLYLPHMDSNISLTKCEYWFDDKIPEYAEISGENINLAVDASALSDGMHTFNYRFVNSNGDASLVNSWMFAKLSVTDSTRQIVSCEYWTDNDYENRSSVSVTDNNVTFSADASKLTQGLHTLNYRLKDSHGIYDAISSWMFMNTSKEDSINSPIKCEYWFDNLYSTRKSLETNEESISFLADASHLSDGFHTLSYRIVSDSICGNIHTWSFIKNTKKQASSLAYCQYWWNSHIDKAVIDEDIADNEEYLWVKELIVPDYAKNDESAVNSTAKLNIIFVDDKGVSSPLVAIDVAYPDNRPPVTTLALTKVSDDSLLIEWEADEDDIQFYNIYVSENNKPFVLWMPNTTATSATFKTKEGVSYRFLVTARDKAGNMEKYDETKCITIK